MKKYQDFVLLALATIATTLVLWLPFLLRLESIWGISLPSEGMATVVANYDGPNYLVIAKTLYDPEQIENNFNFPLEPIYYASHYPLFPLLIKALGTTIPFLGYPYSMILVTLVTSISAVWMFYILLGELGLARQRFWLALLFTVFPARWLIVKSIGSPEPLFLTLILGSIYFARRERWWAAGILGALAQLAKPPGILLFITYLFYLIVPHWTKLARIDTNLWLKSLKWRAFPILLIPLTLLGVYMFYGYAYRDFLAYFNSGDNIHLKFPPFQVFNPGEPWVGTFWLEEIIWLYTFSLLAFIYLVRQKLYLLASFVGVFFLSILFVAHRDIARYSLPIVPFAIIAFAKFLSSSEFKWILALILIPIYLFAISFIANNVTPIGDWSPLL